METQGVIPYSVVREVTEAIEEAGLGKFIHDFLGNYEHKDEFMSALPPREHVHITGALLRNYVDTITSKMTGEKPSHD